MHTVLDLDLDFFVWPIAVDIEEDEQRLDPRTYTLQSEQYVREFLEQRCGLSAAHRIPGRFMVHHVDAFAIWHEWLLHGVLEAPFDVIHVDAHADLGSGFGNQSPKYFETELLAFPLEQRSLPRFGLDAVNSGNYLVAAIANRWINSLSYIYPTDPNPPDRTKTGAFERMEKIRRLLNDEYEDEWFPSDLPAYCFQNGDPTTRSIELKEYPKSGYSRVDCRTRPMHVEPKVRFDWLEGSKFEFSGFTHLVVAQSPDYTPETADSLLKTVNEYFVPA